METKVAAIVLLKWGNSWTYTSRVDGKNRTIKKEVATEVPYYEDAIELQKATAIQNDTQLIQRFEVNMAKTAPDEDDAKRKLVAALTPRETKSGKRQVSKILLIRHGGLGDLLFLLPLAQHYHRINPSARVTLKINTVYAAALQGQPGVDEIMSTETAHNTADYDEVVDFKGVIEANEDAQNIHAVDLMFMKAGFDPRTIDKEFKKGQLFLSDEQKKFKAEFWIKWKLAAHKSVVGFQIKSTSTLRNWPESYYIKLAKFLTERGAAVILLDRAGNGIDVPGVISTAGQLKIENAIAVISGLDCLLAPDSGLSHVAGYLGTPLVALYGAFPGVLRSKYYGNTKQVQAHLDCVPCFNHSAIACPKPRIEDCGQCMGTIQPKEVFEAMRNLIWDIKKVDIGTKS